VSKTIDALKLAKEALQSCEAGNWSMSYDELAVDEALAAIREALAESKPAPDGRIPKTVFTLDDISKAAEMGREAGRIDVLAEQALQKPSDFHQYMEATEPVKQEPVAVISESAIGLVKLHSNGACLPFGTQLYAAPVKREWVDLTDDDIKKAVVYYTSGWLTNARAVIAAYKDKNK